MKTFLKIILAPLWILIAALMGVFTFIYILIRGKKIKIVDKR
jgi:hypothetical protein